MLILGIETSCDETSAAIVADGRTVVSNIVASQIALHSPFGGVVPEIASRQHVRVITQVSKEALRAAGVQKFNLSAIAATYGPGLAGALLVGVNFAHGVSIGLGIPYIPVNHLEGHLHSVWLRDTDAYDPPPPLPMLALIVSGGHTELILMKDHGQYALIGRTLDDAAGEAFDKVARLLGLPYPGGPSIELEAAAATDPVRLPRAWLPGTYDFSFSGLKTAVLHACLKQVGAEQRNALSPATADVARHLSPTEKANLAAGFQDSVIDVLATKTAQAARHVGAMSVAIVGGVAANKALAGRARGATDLPLYIARPHFCTDNAAMIASAAFFNPTTASEADVVPGLALARSD